MYLPSPVDLPREALRYRIGCPIPSTAVGGSSPAPMSPWMALRCNGGTI